MQLATKNDALSADTFDEVVAFNNCFSSSCSHFFLWKISKGLSFNAGCFVSMWQSSCEGLMTSLIVSRHVLEKAGLENVNHLLQWTHNLNRTLGIFFKMQLSFCWQSWGVFCCLTGSYPLFKELPVTFISYSFCLGLTCRLTSTVTETSAWCGTEAQIEEVSKIMGGTCMDQNKCQILTPVHLYQMPVQLKYINSLASIEPATRCSLIVTCHSLIGFWYESATIDLWWLCAVKPLC